MLPNNWRYLRGGGDIYYADMEPICGSMSA